MKRFRLSDLFSVQEELGKTVDPLENQFAVPGEFRGNGEFFPVPEIVEFKRTVCPGIFSEKRVFRHSRGNKVEFQIAGNAAGNRIQTLQLFRTGDFRVSGRNRIKFPFA